MAIATKSILEQQLAHGSASRVTGWPWRLLLFSAVLFGLAVFIFAGMNFGYKTYLNSQLDDIQAQISESNKRINAEDTKRLVTLYSQIINIKNLLSGHPLPSQFFDLIENNTDTRLYFTSLSFVTSERIVKIGGKATDYEALVRQLELFRQAEGVKSVLLDESHIASAGEIDFSVSVGVDPEIFKFKNVQ